MMKHWKVKFAALSTIGLIAGFAGGIVVGNERGIPFVHRVREWSVGIYTGPSPLSMTPAPNITNPVISADDVTDIKAGFVADPFLMDDQGKWYLFFEVLNTATNQGDIGVAHSDDALHWQYDKIVLDEPFHLSYPHVLRWEGKFYMIPESYQAASVRLYEATHFPDQWKFVTTLVRNDFVDTSVFRYNDHWWMLAAANPHGNDKLVLYHADQLTGPWIEHPKSPILIGDKHHARPGGRVITVGDKLYRFAQDDKPAYGLHVYAFEITTLTTTDYSERLVKDAVTGGSGSGWNAIGMHHIDAHQRPDGSWIASVDGYRNKTLFGLKY